MAHQRIRPFNTRDVYPGATLDNDMAMVVRAGHRIFMRGQTGLDLDQKMHAAGDAAGGGSSCPPPGGGGRRSPLAKRRG